MAFTVEETGTLSRLAQVHVPADDFKRNFNKALRRISSRVKVSGFRKGKVPMNVLKRNYGGQVLPDVVDDLVRQNVDEILEKADKVVFLGKPELKTAPSAQEGFEFTLEFELRPALDPIGYLGVDVDRPTVEVTDEELSVELEDLREQFATDEPIEDRTLVEDGDVVDVSIRPLAEGDEHKALHVDKVRVLVGSGRSLLGVEDSLRGVEFGSTVTTTIQLDAEFPIEALREQDVELELTIQSVKRHMLPELDDEFAMDTGMAETLEELRANVIARIKAQKEHMVRHIAEDNLLVSLLKQNEFELPPQLLNQQIQSLLQQRLQAMLKGGMPEDFNLEVLTEEIRLECERKMRTEFLVLSIAEKEGFRVEEDDLKAYFAHQAQHLGTVSADVLEEYVRADPERASQANTNALLEKTLSFLLSEATIKEVAWPVEEDEEAQGVTPPHGDDHDAEHAVLEEE